MLLCVTINEKIYFFQEDLSILEACQLIGIKVPRFCYHENLSIAGNCRMCLVELEKSFKPVIACSTELISEMVIYTNSPMVLKARENILEFLLLNHPLDCPICDQGGECDLQDQALFFGSSFSRNFFNKRSVEDKPCNNLIKTIMNRCIHCTRCVRFGEEICGLKFFGTLNRGVKTEIGGYILKMAISEISVNVVDICPVGALTLKVKPFQIRSWELSSIESIDLTDCLGSNLYLLYKQNNILKVVPKKNNFINDSWLSNKARFYHDIAHNNLLVYPFSITAIIQPTLFLINPDIDLKTLFSFKQLSLITNFINIKLLNSTVLKLNYYFWGQKPKIKQLYTLSNCVCFFFTSNLQIEASVLNIKLRYKIIAGDVKAFSFSPFFKSNFPLKFTKFSIFEIVFLILGKHFFFSKIFFNYNLLFFSCKSILDRLDIYFLKILNNKIPNNIFFNLSAFCNTEGGNYLNFNKFNLKEFLKSKQIFGFNLDDTFLLRKLLNFNNSFLWINRFSSNILAFFNKDIWFPVFYNQDSGLYLNLEQRVQKATFIKKNSKFSINYILDCYYTLLNKNFIKSFSFSFKFFLYQHSKFNYFFEIIQNFFNFSSICFKFSFLKTFQNFNYYYFKNLPTKFSIEDPYRTSLQLKYSVPLIQSSQYLRKDYVL